MKMQMARQALKPNRSSADCGDGGVCVRENESDEIYMK